MLQLCYSSRMFLQGKCYSSAPLGECFPSECIRALFRPPECINSDPLGISFPREKCCSSAFLWPRQKKKKTVTAEFHSGKSVIPPHNKTHSRDFIGFPGGRASWSGLRFARFVAWLWGPLREWWYFMLGYWWNFKPWSWGQVQVRVFILGPDLGIKGGSGCSFLGSFQPTLPQQTEITPVVTKKRNYSSK